MYAKGTKVSRTMSKNTDNIDNNDSETKKPDEVISGTNDEFEDYDSLQNREDEDDAFKKEIKNQVKKNNSSVESGK